MALKAPAIMVSFTVSQGWFTFAKHYPIAEQMSEIKWNGRQDLDDLLNDLFFTLLLFTLLVEKYTKTVKLLFL